MTVVGRLQNSGLPITWSVLRLAWSAQPCVRVPLPKIPTEELLAHAMDQIGYGTPEQEGLVAELAFADGRDTGTIQRCLDGLASEAPEDVERAVRVWRWVLLDELVTERLRQADAAPEVGASTYGVWTDDFRTGMYCGIRDFWAVFQPLSQDLADLRLRIGADLIGDLDPSLSHVQETLRAYRDWLGEERTELLGKQSAESIK